MAFSPRLNSNGIYSNKWWYSSENVYYTAYQLPNCTCYCYGRYAEILGKFYKLPNANGGDWYRLATNFNRGKTPKLGAIACWYSPNGRYAGHVAVVEEIKAASDEAAVLANEAYSIAETAQSTASSFDGKIDDVLNNMVRSVNNTLPDENGNVNIEGSSGESNNVVEF